MFSLWEAFFLLGAFMAYAMARPVALLMVKNAGPGIVWYMIVMLAQGFLFQAVVMAYMILMLAHDPDPPISLFDGMLMTGSMALIFGAILQAHAVIKAAKAQEKDDKRDGAA